MPPHVYLLQTGNHYFQKKTEKPKKEKESNHTGSGWTKAGKNAINKPEGRMADFYCRVLKNSCRTCFSFFMHGFEMTLLSPKIEVRIKSNGKVYPCGSYSNTFAPWSVQGRI